MGSPNFLCTIRHRPVVSCNEAASARGISLSQELKTIVLDKGGELVAAHIRGDRRLNMSIIKKTLGARNITFASISVLAAFNLAPGLVNPWRVGFCKHNLLCRQVLSMPYMATNHDRLDEGVFFLVEELLLLPNLIMGDFGI